MNKAVEDALRSLHEFVAEDGLLREIKEAKQDFFARVGAPLPGEAIEELRLASFIEWFIFDRPLSASGRTPVEDYLRLHADDLKGPLREVVHGFARSVHSIFEVIGRKNDAADLKDLYTGLKYKQARRVPMTLSRGDIAELRLTPAGDAWYATDALCFHPAAARKQIMRLLKQAGEQGKPVGALLEELMAMNTRYERYPKTAKRNAYARG